jgi:hypothetical protein
MLRKPRTRSGSPTRGIFFGCCAETKVLTATSAKALSESIRHFGFSILDFEICEEDLEGNAFMGLSPAFNPKSKIENAI